MKMIAGLMFFLSGGIVLMGIETAEIFYPGIYSISQNLISTLASTPPPNGVISQPSAAIFDGSVIIGGVLSLFASIILLRHMKNMLFLIPVILMSAGMIGVGMFPAKTGLVHQIFALGAFLFGGIAAISSSVVVRIPFAYMAIFLGLITLLFLFLGLFDPFVVVPLLGPGGTERWIVYPLTIWLLGFGSYLMAEKK